MCGNVLFCLYIFYRCIRPDLNWEVVSSSAICLTGIYFLAILQVHYCDMNVVKIFIETNVYVCITDA